MTDARVHDAVVVGGGPAGLAAASWLARHRRDVVVVDSREYRAGRVERSHGYLGRDPQPPLELLELSRQQLLGYPTATYRVGRAVAAAGRRGDFVVDLDDGGRLHALRLVLATGVEDALPDIPGVEEHYGASVFHCPSCDGYDARDRDVVAYGWEPRLVGFAAALYDWARSVTVVTGGRTFAGDEECRRLLAGHDIALVEQPVAGLTGARGDLRAVRLADGRELPASVLFFSVAHRPRTALAGMLGCAVDAEGYVVVDGDGRTTVDGVYAGGDVTPGMQLVQLAAGQGAAAGVAAALSLHGEAGSAVSPTPAPDVVDELGHAP